LKAPPRQACQPDVQLILVAYRIGEPSKTPIPVGEKDQVTPRGSEVTRRAGPQELIGLPRSVEL
jgi:hypothetical protein